MSTCETFRRRQAVKFVKIPCLNNNAFRKANKTPAYPHLIFTWPNVFYESGVIYEIQ